MHSYAERLLAVVTCSVWSALLMTVIVVRSKEKGM